jgi:hypothetical protein
MKIIYYVYLQTLYYKELLKNQNIFMLSLLYLHLFDRYRCFIPIVDRDDDNTRYIWTFILSYIILSPLV